MRIRISFVTFFTTFLICFISFLWISVAMAANVSDMVELNEGRLRYDRRAKISYFDATLSNTSAEILNAPLRVVIDYISYPDVVVNNPDGYTEGDHKPYFEYSDPSQLQPGATSGSKQCRFDNPNRRRFSYTSSVFGELAGGETVSVPDIVGQSQTAAETAITSAGLTTGTVTTVNSDTVPAGNVINQNPAAGTSVPLGSTIEMTVSLGPVMVVIPDVAGQSQTDAENAITSAGLTVGTVTTAISATVAAGNVIGQAPAAGISVPPGSAVDMVISLGPVLTLVALEVTPEEIYFNSFGQTEQLVVTGVYNDGSQKDLSLCSTGTTYIATSSAVATQCDGIVKAMEFGFSMVTVCHGELCRNIPINVDLPQVLPSLDRINAVDELIAQLGDTVSVRWNYRNGSLWNLQNYGGCLSEKSEEAPLLIAQNFILNHEDLFGLNAQTLADFLVQSNYTTAHNGVSHIFFRQMHQGIQLFSNSIQVNVDKYGQVISIGGDYDPDPGYPVLQPSFSAENAVLTVSQLLEPLSNDTLVFVSGPTGLNQETVFDSLSGNGSHVASLTLLSLPDGVHLAWWVTYSATNSMFTVLVDAHTGDVLRMFDMVKDMSGNVFMQDPDKEAQVLREFPERWFYKGDVDRPFPSWGKYCYVAWVANIPNPGSAIYQIAIMENEEDYQYEFQDYIRCYLYRHDCDEPVHDEFFGYFNTDIEVGLSNVFYWTNWLYDYYFALGVDENSGAFQQNDGSRQADETGRMIVALNSSKKFLGSSPAAFAWNTTKEYVSPGEENLGTISTHEMAKWYPRIWFRMQPLSAGYTSDVIIHEYTHGISAILIGGQTYKVPMFYFIQANALAESFSDFFAASITDDPVIGEGLDGPSGMRICPMDNCTQDFSNLKELSDDEYKVSVIFSSTLWDLREAFIEEYGYADGRKMVEQLLIDAMKMTNQLNPDMLDIRSSILAADDENGCGNNQRMIWQVFADHGMGQSATSKNAGDNNPTAGYDLPPDYTRAPEVGPVNVIGTFDINVPLDIDVQGIHFTSDSRVYISEVPTGNIEYVDFEHIDCEEIIIRDYVFSNHNEYDVCVENLVDNEWVEHCCTINTGMPVISQITPGANIPVGQPVSLVITGENLTGVHTVTITDPDDNEVQPAFPTIVDDSHISIPAHTFNTAGQHRIDLISDGGEAQWVVLVEQISTERLDALRGSSLSHTYTTNPFLTMRDDDNTPPPYAETTTTSISTELPSLSAYSNLDAHCR